MDRNLCNAILKALSYFDCFKYPLTQKEIWDYLPVTSTKEEFEYNLSKLVSYKVIYQIHDYFLLRDDITLVQRRVAGNKRAEKKIIKANKIARFLGNFPFVEAVCISGSLSKNFSLPDSDLDFFIITSADRLWIARSMMHAFKKLTFLVGAQHSFCMNYYVSVDGLDICPKNIFTAIELATLKPAFVRGGIEEMNSLNQQWIQFFLPNYPLSLQKNGINGKWWSTRAFEKIIAALNGKVINDFMYQFTKRSWVRKWTRKQYDVEHCLLSMGPHFNTPLNYPDNLHEWVLDTYDATYIKAQKKFTTKIADVDEVFSEPAKTIKIAG